MEIIRPTMQSGEVLQQNNQVDSNQTVLRSELETLVQKQMRVHLDYFFEFLFLIVGGLGSLFVSMQISKTITQLSKSEISSINANFVRNATFNRWVGR